MKRLWRKDINSETKIQETIKTTHEAEKDYFPSKIQFWKKKSDLALFRNKRFKYHAKPKGITHQIRKQYPVICKRNDRCPNWSVKKPRKVGLDLCGSKAAHSSNKLSQTRNKSAPGPDNWKAGKGAHARDIPAHPQLITAREGTTLWTRRAATRRTGTVYLLSSSLVSTFLPSM